MMPYGDMWKMGNRVSTCLYIDRGVIEAAKRMGLNVSKVSENALKSAINRLSEPELGTGLLSRARGHPEGRGRDLNPGARLHRPIGYQATSPRAHFSACMPQLDGFAGQNRLVVEKKGLCGFK